MTFNPSNYGHYTGHGTWKDESGAQNDYGIVLDIDRSDDGLRLRFLHEFFNEPHVDDVKLDLAFVIVAPSILTFEMGPMVGRGHYTSSSLHYDIPIPGNLVSATHFFDDNGCFVVGSSEKNASGNYIVWEERLSRIIV